MERGGKKRGSKRFSTDRRPGGAAAAGRGGRGRGRSSSNLKLRRGGGTRRPRSFEAHTSRGAVAHAYAPPPSLPQYILPPELPAEYAHYPPLLPASDPRFYSDLGPPDAGRVVLVPASYVPSAGYADEYVAPSYLPLRSGPSPVERFVELPPTSYAPRRSSLPLRRRPGRPEWPARAEPENFERKRKLPQKSEGGKKKKKGAQAKKVDGDEAAEAVGSPVEGMIFGCNNKTTKICKKLELFGLPGAHENEVTRVVPGTKLFLFNFDTKLLSGVFEATSNGAMNIVHNAFGSLGSFPAQVKVKRVKTVPRLSLDKLHESIPEIFHKGKHKFKYELNAAQVAKLLELFGSKKDKAAS